MCKEVESPRINIFRGVRYKHGVRKENNEDFKVERKRKTQTSIRSESNLFLESKKSMKTNYNSNTGKA